MNENDVVNKFGEPDEVLPVSRMMTSDAWKCGKCETMHVFDAPVRPPAPCGCGSVFFYKCAKVLH